jgi:hypothetical protein
MGEGIDYVIYSVTISSTGSQYVSYERERERIERERDIFVNCIMGHLVLN